MPAPIVALTAPLVGGAGGGLALPPHCAPMNKRNSGFTLMELMVTLAVAAVILSIGAPSFTEFRRNNRLTGVGNELLGAMQTARTEAIKRQVPVAVCPSDNPGDAGATCSAGAFTGWIVFVDPDNNCVRDAANPLEVVLRVGATIDPAVNVRSNGVCASFGGNGFLQDIPTAATTARNDLLRRPRQGAAGRHDRPRGVDVSTTGARASREPAELNTAGLSLRCAPRSKSLPGTARHHDGGVARRAGRCRSASSARRHVRDEPADRPHCDAAHAGGQPRQRSGDASAPPRPRVTPATYGGAPAEHDCVVTANCTAAELAEDDLARWLQNVDDALPTGVDAQVVVTRAAAVGLPDQYRIDLLWREASEEFSYGSSTFLIAAEP